MQMYNHSKNDKCKQNNYEIYIKDLNNKKYKQSIK